MIDSEIIFCYKLFHSKRYKKKTGNWIEFREIIKKNSIWKRKRSLLLKTSGKFASDELYEMWETKWGISNLSPKIVWEELKSLSDFNDFAQKWHFYALLISRNTIN